MPVVERSLPRYLDREHDVLDPRIRVRQHYLAKTHDGVAVRAEIAAQTDSAVCPPLPDGGTYGAPGQG